MWLQALGSPRVMSQPINNDYIPHALQEGCLSVGRKRIGVNDPQVKNSETQLDKTFRLDLHIHK